ncbi:hypothetical protein L612_002000000440 [Rhodococcus rhodochrous J38]|uniref:hypothetical protein n=1 Tax=Rhodococcus rhodochrous TaxID=1829 RepID=UPI0011AD7EA7|nr:hypothetical protein [Rhodococcus rhodochrous]TWH52633.1 hypothetical protein L612_002000000440 [Rhodococcus rhodochrous J38]
MFWSATNRGHVLYESRLELDRLWLADYAPEVVRIAAQPMWLCGSDGKIMRRHVAQYVVGSHPCPGAGSSGPVIS